MSTSLCLKNDWYRTDDKSSFHLQQAAIYWNKGSLGGGLDLDYSEDIEYLNAKPYLTLSQGPWSLVAGLSLNQESDFVHTGFWYIKRFGKLNLVLDLRNYFATDGKSKDFLDGFMELSFPIGKDFFAGIDLIYDRWWGEKHDWYLAGPLVGYKLSDKSSVFVRLARDWDITDSTCTRDSVRVGLIFKF